MKGFISYAHADQAMFQACHTHLKGIERVLDVRFWADTGIGGGAHWNDEIAKAIAEADIFVLLLSPDWLASEYIEKYEEPAIRARYNPKTGLICPVILRRCDWTDIVPDLQGIPTHGRKVVPIDDWRPKEHGYDAARAEIKAEIRARFNLSSRPAEWRQRLDGGRRSSRRLSGFRRTTSWCRRPKERRPTTPSPRMRPPNGRRVWFGTRRTRLRGWRTS